MPEDETRFVFTAGLQDYRGALVRLAELDDHQIFAFNLEIDLSIDRLRPAFALVRGFRWIRGETAMHRASW